MGGLGEPRLVVNGASDDNSVDVGHRLRLVDRHAIRRDPAISHSGGNVLRDSAGRAVGACIGNEHSHHQHLQCAYSADGARQGITRPLSYAPSVSQLPKRRKGQRSPGGRVRVQSCIRPDLGRASASSDLLHDDSIGDDLFTNHCSSPRFQHTAISRYCRFPVAVSSKTGWRAASAANSAAGASGGALKYGRVTFASDT